MKKIFLSAALLATVLSFGQYTSQTGLRIAEATATATTTAPSPGIKLWGSGDTDGFIYSSRFINNYGFGFYNKTNGDATNNGINSYLSGFFGIDFFTSGQSKVRISREGLVGIGISAPTENLDVVGNIKTSNSFMVGNSAFLSDQGGAIRLKALNSTSLPYLTFNNFNDTQTARLIFRNNSLALEGSKLNMDNKGIEFTTSAYGQGFGVKMYGVDETNGQTSLRFAVRADNATFTDALTIKTSGNIGIGTLTPTEKFEVIGNSKFNGKVGIGTTTFSTNPLYTNYKLFVTGGILSDEVRVALSAGGTWADYVFAKDYKLPTIKEVEKFITKNNHLPNVPSAKQVKEEGINVGEMARIQQEKIEELMLYIIKQDKRIDALEVKLNKK